MKSPAYCLCGYPFIMAMKTKLSGPDKEDEAVATMISEKWHTEPAYPLLQYLDTGDEQRSYLYPKHWIRSIILFL